jgi:hypothetical protein
MALRIRYQRAISRVVSTILRDMRKYPGFDTWWSTLPESTQRSLMERWQRLATSCLDYPDEETHGGDKEI